MSSPTDTAPEPALDPAATEPFEVHRRSWLFALLAAVALGLAAVYAWLAYDRSDVILGVVAVCLVGVALLFVPSLRDFGAPLLVADIHGLRLQSKEGWVGLLWNEIESIRVDHRGALRGSELQVASAQSADLYLVPLGLATTVKPAEVVRQLAKRREAASY